MTKRVLITGGAGFVGHHVIDLFLKKTDWEIISLDRLDYSGNLNRLHDVISQYPKADQKRVKIVWHDLKAEIRELTSNFIGKNINIILHLAASSHVDRSISNPMEFLLDNTLGTVNLLDYARSLDSLERLVYFSTDEIFGAAPPGVLYKEYDRYNSTNPYSASKAAAEEFCVAYENTYKLPIFVSHCHDQNTRCWSEKGIVNIEQLNVGDKVWTLKDNKTLSLEPILEIVNSPYEGEMINFSTNKSSLSVTPNHRMLTKKRNDDSWYINTAEEMSNYKGRQYIPLTGEWDVEDSDVVDLSEYIDYSKIHFNANIPTKIVPKNKFMEFVGWYVTEGFCRTTRRSGPSICQKKNFHSEIEDCMKIFNINISKDINENGTTTFSLHSNAIGDFCSRMFGSYSGIKKLPDWIKNSSKENLQYLFDAMMKGDGTINKSYKRFYTSSYQLAQDFMEIAVKLGYSCGIRERETWNPKKTRKSLSYYVSLRKAVGGIENHQITKTQYKGNIWCVRTSSGNFFIERDGHIACSGNTMNIFGERQHPEKFIPMCIRKIRDSEKIYVHSDPTRTKAGSRFYISAKDVAESMMFLLNLNSNQYNIIQDHMDSLGVRCPKFNIVGKEEIDNLSMVKILAEAQGKEPVYEMVDFHTSRPGHDLRYSLDGSFMRKLGWEPKVTLKQRLFEVSEWSLKNKEWIEL